MNANQSLAGFVAGAAGVVFATGAAVAQECTQELEAVERRLSVANDMPRHERIQYLTVIDYAGKLDEEGNVGLCNVLVAEIETRLPAGDSTRLEEVLGARADEGDAAGAGENKDPLAAQAEGADGPASLNAEPAAGPEIEVALLIARDHPMLDMTVDEIVGRTVQNEGGDELGDIESVVRHNGQLKAIVGVGGFLGIGERAVAVPLDELDVQQGNIVMWAATKDFLMQLPEFQQDDAVALEGGQTIRESAAQPAAEPAG